MVLFSPLTQFLILGIFLLSFVIFFVYIRNITINNQKALSVSRIIRDASYAYLQEQNKVILMISAGILGGIYWYFGSIAAICFLIGSLGSMWSGVVGMYVSLESNIRTVAEAEYGIGRAFKTSFLAGSSVSLYLNAFGLLCIMGCLSLSQYFLGESFTVELPKNILCFAIGANVVSIFARLGGGIYTKGADVGADMVGKVEQALSEDDARNPAVIADNVGDNVGDCAGMAADLFESYVVTITSTILYSISSCADVMAICAMGLLSCVIPMGFMSFKNPWEEMSRYFMVCCLLFMTMIGGYQYLTGMSALVTICVGIGVLTVLLLLRITEYYTSAEYGPVKAVAEASKFGHGTNVISGIALGYESVVLPIVVIIGALLSCYWVNGVYGITLGAIGIAGLSPAILTMDILGPISDNAGGIAEMAGLPENIREVTDELDSIGNTTKAITKGYAIGSAVFAILVMFCSYHAQLATTIVGNLSFSLMDPFLFSGLFIGAIVPLIFSGISMLSVGKAAEKVVEAVRRQVKEFPGILDGSVAPNYNEIVIFLTRFAIKSMILPSLLPIIIPVLCFVLVRYFVGLTQGFIFLSSILLGATVVGVILSIFMVTAGGLWDNAKKYVEKNGLKGSDTHKAAVTGDTVGDPFKDTTGPSLNSVIKLVSLVCIFAVHSI